MLELSEIDAVVKDFSRRWAFKQQDAAAGRRLAATALADEPQRLPAADGEGHAIDRAHLADGAPHEYSFGHWKQFAQAPHLEERGRTLSGRPHAVAPTSEPTSWLRTQAVRWPASSADVRRGRATAQASIATRQAGGRAQPPSTGGR